MINIIVMAHGGLAEEMLKTAGEISGLDVSGVNAFSSCSGNDCAVICARIERIFENSPDGALVLADMFGGSAANVPLQAAKDRTGVRVIAGLNMNMLLSALQNRAKMNIADLAAKVEADGIRGVVNVTRVLKEAC